MKIRDLQIDAIKVLLPKYNEDFRGYFVETWNQRAFFAVGMDVGFVQDNCSYSVCADTIRGLHFQSPPKAQAKLIRAVQGSIFDVAIDLRRSSSSFGQHVAAVLTAKAGEQMFIPVGFAHGFCTLEPDTVVAYKVSEYYSPDHEQGIVWDDADLRIQWPLSGDPVLSPKDSALPRWGHVQSPFS